MEWELHEDEAVWNGGRGCVEWGLHEDEAVWNGDCMRTRLCGMGTA